MHVFVEFVCIMCTCVCVEGGGRIGGSGTVCMQLCVHACVCDCVCVTVYVHRSVCVCVMNVCLRKHLCKHPGLL